MGFWRGVRQVKSVDECRFAGLRGVCMKYLRHFPGRNAANRIKRAHADMVAYVDRWEKDQQVCRVVCMLHYRDGLSYESIAAWLRNGPAWGRRTVNQVRGIIRCARKDYDILAGADEETRAGG